MIGWFHRRGWKLVILGIPYLWMGLFFALPCGIIAAMSLALAATASPPFAFLLDWPFATTENFAYILSDSLYLRAYIVSAFNAATATLLCLALGYPMALAIARTSRQWRNVWLMVVILPFWISFLLRVYAWMGLMSASSWFNSGLTSIVNFALPEAAHLESVPMMNSNFAVVLVMVYSYLPFMILPLYATLERLDPILTEAATDLGARPVWTFLHTTLPLSLPGVIAGSLLTFIPASGEFIIPSLVGDPSDPMIGRVINEEFVSARDWPLASAIAITLMVFLLIPIMVYNHFESRDLERARS
jgi:putrescine transport system permease protein